MEGRGAFACKPSRPSGPPMDGDPFPSSSRCRPGRWRGPEAFPTMYSPRCCLSITLPAPQYPPQPKHTAPSTSFVLHSRFFWSETIFPVFLSCVRIKVRTLLGIGAIGICYLFFSGAKEEAAARLKKALIQPAIASLCFPVTLSTSIRRQWKWYRSKALLPPPRTKRVP